MTNSYVRDHVLPEIFEMSMDSNNIELENYAPIHTMKNDSDEEMHDTTENGLLIPR